MKGMKIYNFTIEAHQRGQGVPRIAKPASTKTLNVPELGQWADPIEETTLQVEHVIAYWSCTLKAAERNYSATE